MTDYEQTTGELYRLPNGDWSFDRSLELARIELVGSKATKLQRHIYHCSDCGMVITQSNYDGRAKKCSCGLYMFVRYTRVGDTLYNGITGEELPSKRAKDKPVSPLKEYRKKHRLSQFELAERLGVDQSFISKIENGEKPMTDSIKRLIS